MATDRTVYHVVPNARGDEWVVHKENNDVFREQFRTKDEAVRAAKQRARQQEPSQVKVHTAEGTTEYERSFGAESSGGDAARRD